MKILSDHPFPWQSSGDSVLDNLGRQAEQLYMWAMKQGMPLLAPAERLREWAIKLCSHATAATENAVLSPQCTASIRRLQSSSAMTVIGFEHQKPMETMPVAALLAGWLIMEAATALKKGQVLASDTATHLAKDHLRIAEHLKDAHKIDISVRRGGKQSRKFAYEDKQAVLREYRRISSQNPVLSQSRIIELVNATRDKCVSRKTVQRWLEEDSCA